MFYRRSGQLTWLSLLLGATTSPKGFPLCFPWRLDTLIMWGITKDVGEVPSGWQTSCEECEFSQKSKMRKEVEMPTEILCSWDVRFYHSIFVSHEQFLPYNFSILYITPLLLYNSSHWVTKTFFPFTFHHPQLVIADSWPYLSLFFSEAFSC